MPLKIVAYLLGIAGLALFIGLIAYGGFTEVISAVAVAGWGLLWVTLFHLVPLVADSIAWRGLFAPTPRLPLQALLRIRWVGESVNNLLPAVHIGGELVRVRLATHSGVPGPAAGASVVVDLTMALFTQIIFASMGIVLLLELGDVGSLGRSVMLGLALFAFLLLGFYLVQRFGLFRFLAATLSRLVGSRDWLSLVGGAAALDDAIHATYRGRRALLVAGGWRLFGWALGTGEVWLALYFLGYPVTVVEAFMLESLGQAVRTAAFAVPGALGVQEGGYILLGALVGLGPELSLALSLVKRVREVLLGVPGLVAWQIAEGRRLWSHRKAPNRP